jgi:ribonuclease HI
MSTSPKALTAGPSEITIYGDGSYQQQIGLGAWAYSVPSLRLKDASVETATTVEHFEIMAALSGIRRALDVDYTARCFRVHTDSEFTLQFLRHASKGVALPPSKTFARVASLYALAIELSAQRRILPTKVNSVNREHRDCHRRAGKVVREALANNPGLAWKVAFRKEEDRLQTIAKEQDSLQRQLDALEDESILIRVRLQSLNSSRPTDIEPPDAVDLVA